MPDDATDNQADAQDAIKPWTIKGIPPEVRNAAIAAAAREKQNIGDWIGRAILQTIKADRQTDRAPAPVTQPGLPIGPTVMDIATLERLTEIAAKLSGATSEPPPPSIVRAIYARMREAARRPKAASASDVA